MFVPQPQSRPKFSPYPSSPHFKIPLGERLPRGDFATYRRFFSTPPLRGAESPLVAPFG